MSLSSAESQFISDSKATAERICRKSDPDAIAQQISDWTNSDPSHTPETTPLETFTVVQMAQFMADDIGSYYGSALNAANASLSQVSQGKSAMKDKIISVSASGGSTIIEAAQAIYDIFWEFWHKVIFPPSGAVGQIVTVQSCTIKFDNPSFSFLLSTVTGLMPPPDMPVSSFQNNVDNAKIKAEYICRNLWIPLVKKIKTDFSGLNSVPATVQELNKDIS